MANGAPDWCGIGEVDWCLSVNCKSTLIIPFSFARNCRKELFWIQKYRTQIRILTPAIETSLLELERLGMSRVLRNKKVKAISTLASRQDLLAVLKPTPLLFTSCQNAACSNTLLFFFVWRVHYALEGSMFDWANVIFFFSLFPPPPRSLWLAPFPPLFGSFNMALSRAKTFAHPKKTPALQAKI